jgi:hypothetical protein
MRLGESQRGGQRDSASLTSPPAHHPAGRTPRDLHQAQLRELLSLSQRSGNHETSSTFQPPADAVPTLGLLAMPTSSGLCFAPVIAA